MADKDKDKNNQLNLGCLEEDDEFEEFPVEGLYFIRSIPSNKFIQDFCSLYSANIQLVSISFPTEWADGKENEDEVNVWEDNWDDDNVEDDFNNQLRAQLESQKK